MQSDEEKKIDRHLEITLTVVRLLCITVSAFFAALAAWFWFFVAEPNLMLVIIMGSCSYLAWRAPSGDV